MVDSVTIQITPSLAQMRRIIAKVGTELTHLRKPHEEVGEDMEDVVKDRIDAELKWRGGRLAPLKDATKERRTRRGTGPPFPILQETQKMRNSIDSKVSIGKNVSKTTIGPQGAQNNKLMFFHHHGTRHMAARRTMGLTQRNIRDIEREFERHINVILNLR